ncbi:hypothetical protein DFH28DRAFT_1066091 [Melampsora americana]|nr:hypothetical protein DFH28DRAFT_1066091 [Melampsora americana]
MGGKRLTRFFTSSSVSTPKRRERSPRGEAKFREAADKRQKRLDHIHNPPPPAPAPPPPEWVRIAGDDEHQWIDMDEEPPPEEIVRPAPYRRRQRYRTYFDKRQDFSREWGHLEHQITATYLYCQHTTKNWTSRDSYHDAKPSGCVCTPEQLSPARRVDLIDLLGFQSSSFSFCKCQPEAIQLLYKGYISSSPSKPCTAFSVRTVQLYHTLWQRSGLVKSGFVEGLLQFISGRTRQKLTARGLSQKSRILRVPFSNTYDVYARTSRLQPSLYHEGMLHTKEDLWAAKCARCFGPAEGEEPADGEFFSIFCMDGNFQQRHNTEASKDQPLDDQYPPIFVKPADIQRNEEVLNSTSNVNLEGRQVLLQNSGNWLLSRMKQAHETVQKSRTLLTNICTLPNPHEPGHLYTETFLDQQWHKQKEAMVNPKVQQETQKLELGKLLCLQDEHDLAWNTVINTPEQAIARARLVGDLQKRIEAQKKKVGSDAMTNDLSEQHSHLLLKLWYSKTTVRHLFLALKEEKRPLEIVQQVGMSTKLGQRGQQKVLAAIKTRAAKLRPALDTYNRNLTNFEAAFPNRAAPRHIDYQELLAIEADHAFWNDGLFTYDNQPWAIDGPTQVGMRALARLRRGNEEIQHALISRTWHYQRAQVSYLQHHGFASMIEGDYEGVIAGVLAFYNIAPEFTADDMVLRRAEENIPEEPQEAEFGEASDLDEAELELEGEEIEVVFEKFMHLDEIDAAQQEADTGDLHE